MNKLRELISEQPKFIGTIAAAAFISEMKDVDMIEYNIIVDMCDCAKADLDLVSIALGPVLDYEKRAREVLRMIDISIANECKIYIDAKLADFEEEDESEVMDDSDPKTAANSLMGWDPR